MLNYQKKIEEFYPLFGHDKERLFDTFINLMFYTFTLNMQEVEKIKKELNKQQLQAIRELMETFGEDGEKNPFTDILGDYFLDLKRSKKAKQYAGEFYTPQTVCDAMSRMTIDLTNLEISKHILGKPCSILEPSCGTGRMLLSAAKTLLKKYPQFPLYTYLLTVGVDINLDALKIATINTTMWGIPFIAIHGNTITFQSFTEKPFFNIFFAKMAEFKKFNAEEQAKKIMELTLSPPKAEIAPEPERNNGLSILDILNL